MHLSIAVRSVSVTVRCFSTPSLRTNSPAFPDLPPPAFDPRQAL